MPAAAVARPWEAWISPTAIGFALVLIAIVVYWSSGTVRFYNHFVWQAMAFLQGQAAIDFPVPPSGTSAGNSWFQDVMPLLDANGQPTGKGILPFPPLPAVVLMPAVALFGLATDERVISVLLGAVDVGLAWWLLGKLPIDLRSRFLATAFFGFGTVLWYAAQLGTTWFLAHVVALAALLPAVGLAMSADRGSAFDEPQPERAGGLLRSALADLRAPTRLLDRRQLAAGFLFGLACTARLTIAFGAPFFVFVGGGGSWLRRAVSAGVGAAIPFGALLVYNLVSTGHLFNPAYDYQYQLEAYGYPALHYNPEWSIEDPRYIPQNFGIAFLSLPTFHPDALPCATPGGVRGLFDPACPLALPRDTGMSLFLTSPALVFVIIPLVRQYGRSRLVTGAALAGLVVAIVNLMHFSQGWVQFGYRFSNDYIVFLLLLVALGMSMASRRRAGLAVAVLLVGASIAINFWGTWWGMKLGW